MTFQNPLQLEAEESFHAPEAPIGAGKRWLIIAGVIAFPNMTL
jgi:hypothetical protein